jgi:hypothetical protein
MIPIQTRSRHKGCAASARRQAARHSVSAPWWTAISLTTRTYYETTATLWSGSSLWRVLPQNFHRSRWAPVAPASSKAPPRRRNPCRTSAGASRCASACSHSARRSSGHTRHRGPGEHPREPYDEEATYDDRRFHPRRIRAIVASSGRPSHQRSRAWRNGLFASSAAIEKSVAHDRNFMSSGEPKIEWSDDPTIAFTVFVQSSSLDPRTGWAR